MKFVIDKLTWLVERELGIPTFQKLKQQNPDKYSWLGTKVFGIFIFEAFEYELLGVKYSVPRLELSIAILSVAKQNTIIETGVKGRDGTIKEFISTSDYSIALEGVLVEKDMIYPYEQLKKLDIIASAKSAIPVTNDLLNSLGIYKVVVKQYSTKQIQGVINKVQISIDMVSDTTEL